MKRIFQGTSRKKTDLTLIIMASQSIGVRIRDRGPQGCELLVRDNDYQAARTQLDAYHTENTPVPRPVAEPRPFWSGTAAVIVLFLILVHAVGIRTGIHDQLIFRFGISPYFIAGGDTFRAITALFLHADAGHLMGNAAGILVMAGPLIRLTGPGTGCFLLLSAATSGNLVAAALKGGSGISIGASTAVMGAAGILSIHRAGSGRQGLKRLAPLIAGATLMALFSHGERTDVAAHLFGFLCGAAVGMAGLFPAHQIKISGFRRQGEAAMMILTLAILLAALAQAMAGTTLWGFPAAYNPFVFK